MASAATRVTGRPGGSSRWPALRRLAILLAIMTLIGLPWPANAAPSNPGDAQLSAAQQAQEAAAAEVGRAAAELAAAQAGREQANAIAMAAADAQLVAEAALERAQQEADQATASSAAAAAAADAAQVAVNQVATQAYMRSGDLGGLTALLFAGSPSEMLQQAAALEYLAADRSDILGEADRARVQMADAEAEARTRLAAQQAAEDEASAAQAAATQQLAQAEATLSSSAARDAALQQQLQDAQVRLLELQGERNAYQAWLAQQAAATSRPSAATAPTAPRPTAAPTAGDSSGGGRPTPAPQVSSGGSRITAGQFTSCYEMRWGTMHNGVDIAAPIGTPIYAPAAGRVVRAGAATGFGLAVYIQHDDGTVTVYGHINDYFVTTGERVSAGQLIAEVGNRGQSTGPHVHVEVHSQGMYQGRTNPMPWLRAQGVEMNSPCS